MGAPSSVQQLYPKQQTTTLWPAEYDKKAELPNQGNPAISDKRPVVFRPCLSAGLAFFCAFRTYLIYT